MLPTASNLRFSILFVISLAASPIPPAGSAAARVGPKTSRHRAGTRRPTGHVLRYWVVLLAMSLAMAWSPSAALGQTLQELRIRWDAYLGAPAPHLAPHAQPPSNAFTLLDRRSLPGSLPRQRDPQLSLDQIVVVAVDARGQPVAWQLIPDPRLIRAEGPAPTGELGGEVLHRAVTELVVALPNDPAIVGLQLYQPRWTGAAFALDALGTIRLP